MNLVYIDDTGNTGLNLKDNQQPIFVLVSIIVHSSKWFAMEKEFYDILKGHFGKELPEDFELKAVNLRSGANHFKGLSMESRLAIRDRMFKLLLNYKIPIIYRRIIKSKFEEFCEKQYGPGIKINPYVMALPFVCMEIDNYLRQKNPAELGMLIFDEQKESFNEDLKRWFKEKWVDVSKKVDGKHPPCGRKDADGKAYPKCRPSKKVSSETPKVASSYDKSEKKSMTQQKRRAEKKDPKIGTGNKPTMTHYKK